MTMAMVVVEICLSQRELVSTCIWTLEIFITLTYLHVVTAYCHHVGHDLLDKGSTNK